MLPVKEPDDDERRRTRAHADGEEAERAGALHERPRQHVIEGHADHRPQHDRFAAPGAGGRGRQSRGKRGDHAEHGDADAGRFADTQRLVAEQRADHHGRERQRRQRETGARRGRVGHRDVVEHEEQAEEAEAEQHHPGQVTPFGPTHLQQKAAGNTQRKPMPQRRIASAIGSAPLTR